MTDYSYHRQFINPGDLVFDVGAFVGDKTAEFLDLGARIVCFEPQLRAVHALKRRFQTRVVVEQVALGDHDGDVPIFVCPDHPAIATVNLVEWTATRFGGPDYKWYPAGHVRMTTLTQMVAQYGLPAFVKIDAEGSDLDVLRGLACPVPALSFEVLAERLDAANACIDRVLEIMPSATFQLVVGDGATIAPDDFMPAGDFRLLLAGMCVGEPDLWGDVFARSAP